MNLRELEEEIIRLRVELNVLDQLQREGRPRHPQEDPGGAAQVKECKHEWGQMLETDDCQIITERQHARIETRRKFIGLWCLNCGEMRRLPQV